jgi:hypothetical protein
MQLGTAQVREANTTALGSKLDEDLARSGMTCDTHIIEVPAICDSCRF